MNKRIEEIAEQAWVYQMTVYEHNGVRTFGEREKVFSKEKFAELIVGECVTEAIDEVAFHGGSIQIEAGIRKRLYQHFGVE